VWAVIRPEGYEPPSAPEDFDTPAIPWPIVELLDGQNQVFDDVYEGIYQGFKNGGDFSANGVYEIIICAQDKDKNITKSQIYSITLTGGTTTTTLPPTTTTTTLPMGQVKSYEFKLSGGWNLVSSLVTVDLEGYFADSTFISIWKWQDAKWWVRLPGTVDKGEAYASAKGFLFLKTINPGEGFWVNSQGQANEVVEGQ
jgi:hypothetical protein